MNGSNAVTLWDCLGEVPDHRSRSGRRFSLRSIVALAIGAALSGRTSLASIARWGRKMNKDLLRAFGIDRETSPCQSTFHYVFRDLKVNNLEVALAKWVRALVPDDPVGHVALDGKELRASRSGRYRGVRLIAAFCEKAKGVIAQRALPQGSNEITAALRLIKETPLEGAVVTGDAIFAQQKVCEEIIKSGGDYFFVVKDNQKSLREHIETAFLEPASPLGGSQASS